MMPLVDLLEVGLGSSMSDCSLLLQLFEVLLVLGYVGFVGCLVVEGIRKLGVGGIRLSNDSSGKGSDGDEGSHVSRWKDII